MNYEDQSVSPSVRQSVSPSVRQSVSPSVHSDLLTGSFPGKSSSFLSSVLSAFIILVFLSPLHAREPEDTSADALWKESLSFLDARRYRDAHSLFNDFIKRHFYDERVPEARVYIGICDYRIGGRTSRALDTWNRVVNMELMQKRASPALLLGLEQFSRHYRAEGQTADWQKTIERLFDNFPDDPVTIREGKMFAKHCLMNEDWAGAIALYQRFEGHLSRQDKEDLMLARAMSESGASANVIIKAANSQLARDSVGVAERLYREALRRNPREDEKHKAMTKLGWCLYLQDKDKEAEHLWMNVLKSASRGDEWRGKSRWHLVVLNAGPYENVAKAIELCDEQAKEFDKGFFHEQALFSKAWLLWTRNRWADSRAAFEELIRHYPEKAIHPPIMRYIEDCEEGINKTR